ncbi:MAG: glycosyltransferase [Candidatus Omnitrophica bacterium]|nr:glycosyltransferase [Candidatus Omnitrophota bacterium]
MNMNALREVIIELTSRCNLDCAFCFNKQGKSKNCGELTKADIIGILKDISASGVKAVRFTGGEPFLRMDLSEILRAAKQLGLYTIVNSNGMLIPDKGRRVFQDIDLLLLSLHNHLWFKKTRVALDALSESPNTAIMLATIAIPENVVSLGKFYDFVSQIKVSNFKEWFLLRPVPNLKNMHPITRGNLATLYKSIKYYNKKYAMNVFIANALPFCATKDDLSLISKGGKFDSGHSRVFVDSSGQYRPDYSSSILLGSFKERSLAEIWGSSVMRRIRNYECLNVSCRKCFYLEKCKGGLGEKEYLRKPDNLGPLVSVIIPTFNASDRLKVVIESLRHQTYRGFEVVVVDDGSSDDTKSVVNKLKKIFGLKIRYYYLHNPDIFGAALARNLGAKMAKGRILVFLDQDAAAHRRLIELYLERHKESDIVLGYYAGYNKQGPYYNFKEISEKLFKDEVIKTINPDFRDGVFSQADCYQGEAWKYFVSANFSIKKDIFLEYKFDEKITKWTGEDIDLGYRLFINGYRFIFAKDCLAYDMVGAGMLTREKFNTLNEMLIYIYGKYRNKVWEEYLFERFNHTPLNIRGNAKLVFRNGKFIFYPAQTPNIKVEPRSREVSFYVPCYNGQRYLKQCLQSVVSQKYPLKEIILVNDGSTDKTLEVASRFPVKVISHMHNRGLAAARNTAISKAKGDFVASIDADCIVEKDWLEKLMLQFNSPGIAGAGGRLDNYNYRENILDRWRALRMVQHWGDKPINPDFLFGCDTVFYRNALVDVGLYDERLRTNGEDHDISEKLLKKGYEIKYSPLARVYHLRKDSLESLLDTFWRYNFCYLVWVGKYYVNIASLPDKIKENLWLAKKFMVEDLKEKRFGLFYIDFLLPVYITLRDLQYLFSIRQYDKTTQKINNLLARMLELSLDKRLLGARDRAKLQKNAFKKCVLMLLAIVNNLLDNKEELDGFCNKFEGDLFSIFFKEGARREVKIGMKSAYIPWANILEGIEIKEYSEIVVGYLKNFLGLMEGFHDCFPLQDKSFRSFLNLSRQKMVDAGKEYNTCSYCK